MNWRPMTWSAHASESWSAPTVANFCAKAQHGGPRAKRGKQKSLRGLGEMQLAGLEPATFGSVDRCSIQLS
jgi:hypothetical protein